MEFQHLRDGKVAETCVGDDVPSILVQLGVMAMPS